MRDRPVATEKIAVFSGRGAWRLDVSRRRPSTRQRRAIVRRRRGASPRLSCVMANIHSQKKRILRAERERLENRRYTSAIKTYFRRLEAAVAAGDDERADAEHQRLVS